MAASAPALPPGTENRSTAIPMMDKIAEAERPENCGVYLVGFSGPLSQLLRLSAILIRCEIERASNLRITAAR
jgi:hypothetical protein